MSMGQQQNQQLEFWIVADDLPQSPGSAFYRRLNDLLSEAGFDRAVEELCAPYYKDGGRPSIPPGRYFRMLLVGYFEGIQSQRGIAWRCADSLSLREFLGCTPNAEKASDRNVPDHSSLTRVRDRLPLEVHEEVFLLVLTIAREKKMLNGKTLLVDSTLLEANASMRNIVNKVSGESWNEYVKELAKQDGIEEPTAEDARRVDQKRTKKKVSNQEWESKYDPDARIAKMKDGRTRLAYKAEVAVDSGSGLIVSAGIEHAAGTESTDSETIKKRLVEAAVAQAKIEHDTQLAEVIADKGYHKVSTLHWLEQAGIRSYISEKKEPCHRRWTDKPEGYQGAYYANRRRIKGDRGKALMRTRGEYVERSFAHCCETGGGRRLWLRGVQKTTKRWLILTVGHNLGIIMRALFNIGKPRILQDMLRKQEFTLYDSLFMAFCMAQNSLQFGFLAILKNKLPNDNSEQVVVIIYFASL